MCIQLKPLFSRHKGIGVQFTDEPTGNLDSKTSDDVIGLLKMTSKEFHQTIVMITHNPEIAQMADCMVRIDDGSSVEPYMDGQQTWQEEKRIEGIRKNLNQFIY